ncbi:trehalose-phosphatase [Microbacterium sp. 18062]|uniref:trehalose-phosphatase n=1 Tax=Microbacterium sp. 18062 TaxID=2681410 RepID=UPI001356FEC9|nr:trehalose-phosphatase [Microbacterium sp. 18062]
MDTPAAALRALTEEPNAGLVMDFDGVLSRITDRPESSELLPGTADLLAALATRLSVVALLSGRPAAFLAERAAVPGVELYGSYGLEQHTDGRIDVVPDARQWVPAVRQAADELHSALDDVAGISVEDKSLAVAVHWRRADDRDAAAHLIAPLVQEIVDRLGLRREPGKLVEELRMPLDQDKGTALERIIRTRDLQSIAYAGDDLGDLPAFEAAISVGGHALVVEGPDADRRVLDVPGAHFDGPAEFQAWLRRLSESLH